MITSFINLNLNENEKNPFRSICMSHSYNATEFRSSSHLVPTTAQVKDADGKWVEEEVAVKYTGPK